MKKIIAISILEDRIAPVFDTAGKMLIVEIENEKVLSKTHVGITSSSVHERVLQLKSMKIDELVCGAISRVVQEQIVTNKIPVVSFISGDIEEVIAGWLEGSLTGDNFAMPGCCGRRRRLSQNDLPRNMSVGCGVKRRQGELGGPAGRRSGGRGKGIGLRRGME